MSITTAAVDSRSSCWAPLEILPNESCKFPSIIVIFFGFLSYSLSFLSYLSFLSFPSFLSLLTKVIQLCMHCSKKDLCQSHFCWLVLLDRTCLQNNSTPYWPRSCPPRPLLNPLNSTPSSPAVSISKVVTRTPISKLSGINWHPSKSSPSFHVSSIWRCLHRHLQSQQKVFIIIVGLHLHHLYGVDWWLKSPLEMTWHQQDCCWEKWQNGGKKKSCSELTITSASRWFRASSLSAVPTLRLSGLSSAPLPSVASTFHLQRPWALRGALTLIKQASSETFFKTTSFRCSLFLLFLPLLPPPLLLNLFVMPKLPFLLLFNLIALFIRPSIVHCLANTMGIRMRRRASLAVKPPPLQLCGCAARCTSGNTCPSFCQQGNTCPSNA